MMEPDIASTAHMQFVDNRCDCCPYGYHIDIDFLRYLEVLGRSTTGGGVATDFQQISDSERRRLMEMWYRSRGMEASGGGGGDVLRSGGDFIDTRRHQLYDETSLVEQHDDQTSRRFLIDSTDRSSLYTDGRSSGPSTRTKYRSDCSRLALVN